MNLNTYNSNQRIEYHIYYYTYVLYCSYSYFNIIEDGPEIKMPKVEAAELSAAELEENQDNGDLESTEHDLQKKKKNKKEKIGFRDRKVY